MGAPEPSAFHTRTVRSHDAETKGGRSGVRGARAGARCASGLHAAEWTSSSWPRSTMGSPEPSAFHTRTVRSHDAETMRSPSGLHDAERTRPSWPRITRGSPEPSAFHTRTVRSHDAET